MDKVVRLGDMMRATKVENVEDVDEFLISEGLELLAAYRAISNIELRDKIRGLVKELAALDVLAASAKQ